MPLAISLESIRFQNDKFFRELTLLVAELKKVPQVKLQDSDLIVGLESTIRTHSGLRVAIEMGAWGPAVEAPSINRNNVVANPNHRQFMSSVDGTRMIAEAGSELTGGINLISGKVSGVFADVQHRMYMPTEMFTGGKFSPEEIAATMLHEIGHLCTYYEFITRSTTANRALTGMAAALDTVNSVDEREAILVSVKKVLNLHSLDTKALAKSTDKKVVEVVVISNLYSETADAIGANIYDFNTWEYLSDQYAARHGAGRHLVLALEKLYRSAFHISFRGSASYLAMEALKFFMILTLPLAPVAGLVGLLLVAMDGVGDGTYDRPGARLLRVRNQVVEAMKDKRLKGEEAKRLQEDLVAIDEVLATVRDREQFFGVVWNLFSKSSRKRMADEAMAKELEGFVANNLFVESMKLRQLARQ